MRHIISRKELIDGIYKEFESVDDSETQKVIQSLKRNLMNIPEDEFIIFMKKSSIHLERLRKNTYYLKYAC